MTTSVKYFHSELPGAPVLSGTAGSRIAVLDACLLNGWGLLTASGVVVASGVATATFTASHSFEPHTVVLVAGASVPEINGEQRVTTTASLSISWPAPGVADGPVSGTITIKLAPAGWQKLSGTNKAAYKSGNVSASGCWIQIDDTAPRWARLRAFDAMTDVDTGTGPTPSDAQKSGGLYIAGSDTASSAARKWIVVATDKAVILMVSHYNNNQDYAPSYFGDFPSLKSGDAYNCMLTADPSDNSQYPYVGYLPLVQHDGTGGVYIVRSYTQVGESIPGTLRKPGLVGLSGGSNLPIGPNPINNSLELCPTLLYEQTGTSANRRGSIPGVYGIPHALGAGYGNKTTLTAPLGLPGRTLLFVQNYSNGGGGRYAIDITGPWE